LERQILLFGALEDAHLDAVEAALKKRQADVVRVSSRALPLPLELHLASGEGLSLFLGGNQARLKSALIRALPPRQGPQVLQHLDQRVPARDVLHDAAMARGRRALARAFFVAAQKQGVRLLNPPSAAFFFPDKVSDLDLAQRLGLPIPPTHVVGRAEQLPLSMAQLGGDGSDPIIAKPPAGGAPARFLRPSDPPESAALAADPLLLQPFLKGALIRLLILNGEVLAVGALEGWQGPDHRQDPDFVDGTRDFVATKLSVPLLGKIRAFAEARGLDLCSVELLQVAGQEGIFLECNPAPAWLRLEAGTKSPITAKIAEALMEDRA
jgi:glutathione synthase/RimK-type ligase-like ATP-grasp enzyme